ncbi:hypothetical protein NPIL_211161, partial [Nephila pilipes]
DKPFRHSNQSRRFTTECCGQTGIPTLLTVKTLSPFRWALNFAVKLINQKGLPLISLVVPLAWLGALPYRPASQMELEC